MPRGEHAAPLMGARESISDSLLESQASPSLKPVRSPSLAFAKSNVTRHAATGDKAREKAGVFIACEPCAR